MTGPQKHQVKQYFLFCKITACLSGIQESPFFLKKKSLLSFSLAVTQPITQL